LGPKVIAVDFGESFPHNQAQPKKQRDLRVRQIIGKFGNRVRESVLKYVRCVDSAANSSIESSLDHPQQAVAVADECFPRRSRIAATRPLD
jgi:hypothetical protein